MTSKMTIPIARTSLLESEVQSVIQPLQSGWLVQGPKVRTLVEVVSIYRINALAVTSCTTLPSISSSSRFRAGR